MNKKALLAGLLALAFAAPPTRAADSPEKQLDSLAARLKAELSEVDRLLDAASGPGRAMTLMDLTVQCQREFVLTPMLKEVKEGWLDSSGTIRGRMNFAELKDYDALMDQTRGFLADHFVRRQACLTRTRKGRCDELGATITKLVPEDQKPAQLETCRKAAAEKLKEDCATHERAIRSWYCARYSWPAFSQITKDLLQDENFRRQKTQADNLAAAREKIAKTNDLFGETTKILGPLDGAGDSLKTRLSALDGLSTRRDRLTRELSCTGPVQTAPPEAPKQ